MRRTAFAARICPENHVDRNSRFLVEEFLDQPRDFRGLVVVQHVVGVLDPFFLDSGETGLAFVPVAGAGSKVADDPGVAAGDPEHRAGDLFPDGHRLFKPEQIGGGCLVPGVAVPDDPVAALAGLVLAVADAPEVLGEKGGALRRQVAVVVQ